MKKEITAVRSVMSHLLARVEDMEKCLDTVTQLAFSHRSTLYKLEDFEKIGTIEIICKSGDYQRQPKIVTWRSRSVVSLTRFWVNWSLNP